MKRLRIALVAAAIVCAGCGTVAVGQRAEGQVTGQGSALSTAAQVDQDQVGLGSARNRAGSGSLAGAGTPAVVIRTGTTQPRAASTSQVESNAFTNGGPALAASRCGVRVGKTAPMCPVGSP